MTYSSQETHLGHLGSMLKSEVSWSRGTLGGGNHPCCPTKLQLGASWWRARSWPHGGLYPSVREEEESLRTLKDSQLEGH